MLFASWLLLRKSVIFHLIGRVDYLSYFLTSKDFRMLSSAQVIHFFETQIDHAHTVVSALLLSTQLQRIKNISFRNLSNLSHQREMSNQLLISSELGLHIAHSSEKEPLKLWVPLQIKLQHLEHQLLQQREPRMLVTDR